MTSRLGRGKPLTFFYSVAAYFEDKVQYQTINFRFHLSVKRSFNIATRYSLPIEFFQKSKTDKVFIFNLLLTVTFADVNESNVVVEVWSHVEVVVEVNLVDGKLLLPGVSHLHDVVPHPHVVDFQPLPAHQQHDTYFT